MADRAIGARRDAHLEFERLIRDSGPVFETAVNSAREIHAPFFSQTGPDLRHRLTGETVEAFVKNLRKTHPHYYADYEPVSEEQVMYETIENACLTPSPATLAKLFKAVGELRYNELLKAWGTDAARMLPGTRPGYAERQAAEGKANGAKASDHRNPWHPNFHGTPEQREAEKTRLLPAIGSKRCAAMAAEAGVTVLGWPLRK
jgi:hypothetical protein